MTGAELIKWIQNNQAEDLPVSVLSSEDEYMKVKNASIKEMDESMIVLSCYREEDIEQKVIADIIAEVNEEKNAIWSEIKLTPGEKGCIEEYRRKYWAYLLRCLNKYHGPEGPYRNIHTSKSCYLYSSIGISNFAIVCEAKKKDAGIEVVFKKPDRAVNKAAFEYLKEKEKQIRDMLGTSVLWWDKEEWTYFYIHLGFKGVADITNEDTWENMARFHMEWSKKFYTVFVRLLNDWKTGK